MSIRIETENEAREYLIKHLDSYDEVTIISYTPSLLLQSEAESIQTKGGYANALLNRCQGGKATLLYVAAGGLRNVLTMDRKPRANQLQYWEEILKIEKAHPDTFRIFVLGDEILPSVSLVIGHRSSLERVEKEWGKELVLPPWDLMIEYWGGITADKLFKMGSRDGENSKWEFHIGETDLSQGIKWITDRLKDTPCISFEKWLEKEKIRLSPPPPRLAILSAMPLELRSYRPEIARNANITDEDGNLHAEVVVNKFHHEIVFPQSSYGRNQIGQNVISVCGRFPTAQTLILVGVAGGAPLRDVKIGDVVISEEIIDLTSEKVLSREKSKSQRIKGKLVDLSSDKVVELRTEPFRPSNRLVTPARTLRDRSGAKSNWWKELVNKYLVKCAASEVRNGLMQDMPSVHLGRIWSSDQNINDESYRDQLIEKYEVEAFEMEGGGFAQAAERMGAKYIEIRGISDLADGNRDNDAILQPIAVAVAGACLEGLLGLFASN